jgi:hypothetical protein
LSEEIKGAKTPSVEEAVAMLTGKDKRSIPKSKPRDTKDKKAKRDSKKPDHIAKIPKIDYIAEIPDGFPDGTILNDDGTLTLPDGRMIRKKQEVNHG